MSARQADSMTAGRSQLRACASFFALALGLFSSPLHSLAGNTWDGGGLNDDWGTGANWSPDGTPSPGGGNDLFFAGSTRLTPNNNYTAFDDWRNITFSSGAGSFNITGNAIDLFGKIENLSSNAQTAGFGSIALNSASANEFNPVNGNLNITGTNVFTNGNQLKVFGNNGFTLNISASTIISQAGSVAINQNSSVLYNSAHTYTGDTFVNAGTLQFNNAATSIASGTTLRLGDTAANSPAATFALVSGGSMIRNLVVRPSVSGTQGTRTISSLASSGTATISGNVYLDADAASASTSGGTLAFTGTEVDLKNQTLTVGGAGTTTFSSATVLKNSTGTGKLTKTGSGTLTLGGNSTYSGQTSIQQGVVNIQHANALGNTTGNTTVSSGAALQIQGSITTADEALSISGGGISSDGALRNVSGTNNYAGLVSLTGSARISADSGSTLNLTNTGTTTGNFMLTLGGGGNINVSGSIGSGGTTALTKVGSGTASLTGTSAFHFYSGNTTVNEGTLNVSGLLSENGSTDVFIAAGDLSSTAPTLTRNRSANGNTYAGFGSTVTSGLQTSADIRAATADTGADIGVTMQWRLRNANESSAPAYPPLIPGTILISEVLELTGMAISGGGSGQTRPFALEMSYDPSLPINESASYLVWLDTTGTPQWKNAVLGNIGTGGSAQTGVMSSWSAFASANSINNGPAPSNPGYLGNFLGSWGVDTVNNKVWAVLNHNSQFAVVPEPSSLALAVVAGIFLWLFRRSGI